MWVYELLMLNPVVLLLQDVPQHNHDGGPSKLLLGIAIGHCIAAVVAFPSSSWYTTLCFLVSHNIDNWVECVLVLHN